MGRVAQKLHRARRRQQLCQVRVRQPGARRPQDAVIPTWPSPSSRQAYTTWTITLRKGTKWSDGTPLTADDIMFWYNDILLNRN